MNNSGVKALVFVLGAIMVIEACLAAGIAWNAEYLNNKITALELNNSALEKQQNRIIDGAGFEMFKMASQVQKKYCESFSYDFTAEGNYIDCANANKTFWSITYNSAVLEDDEIKLWVTTYLASANKTIADYKCETALGDGGLYDFANCAEQNKTISAI